MIRLGVARALLCTELQFYYRLTSLSVTVFLLLIELLLLHVTSSAG